MMKTSTALKIVVVVVIYIATYTAYNKAEASTVEQRVMYCNMFQARFDSFGAALKDGISIERLNKVINETSSLPEEAVLYKSMVSMLLVDNLYMDTLAVAKLGLRVKQECVRGVQDE